MDIKITDDEDDEEVDVTGPVKSEPVFLPEPIPLLDNESVPSMQFFVVSRWFFFFCMLMWDFKGKVLVLNLSIPEKIVI